METMRCIMKEAPGPGNIRLASAPVPVCGENDVLVRVGGAAVCGTDVHIMHWNEWAAKRLSPPMIIGHEFAGEVVERGKNVKHIQLGDIVSAETHIACNTCALCHNDDRHVCPNTRTIGVHRDGCFSEYIAFPAENAFVCDPALPIEVNSLMEPLGVAVHAALEFPLAGKSVAVVGCGPIGLMAVAVAKKIGAAQVIAVEPNEMRAKLAMEMGADCVVNPLREDAVTRIKALTGGLGVENAIDFSGNIPAVKAALQYLRPAGRFAAAGLPGRPIDFDFAEFVYRGIQLHGIAGRLMFSNWEQMRGLLAAGLDISKVVTHVMPLEQYEEGLRLMAEGQCGKVILKP